MAESLFIKVGYEEVFHLIQEVLLKSKIELAKAKEISEVLANTTLDGINSHGINRLLLLCENIKKGLVSISAEPKITSSSNFYCQVDGHLGLGIHNALYCTDRAMEIALENGIGIVALKNTNHWHRGGTYGWKAAEKGFILIAWTNTMPNLTPYGASENLIGNNPLVIAIPKNDGHIVLDMALSQYSYGAIANYSKQKKELPEIGGYDKNGNLTKDASKIRITGNHLPIGFWKGSGLSIVLDLIAAILSGGKTTTELRNDLRIDTGMSQVFIAIDPKKFGNVEFQQNLINITLENFRNYSFEKSNSIRYPGQGVLERRKENLKNGIPIEKDVWEKILAL